MERQISLGSFNEICSNNPPDYYKERVTYWKPSMGMKPSNMTPEKMQEALKRLAVTSQLFVLNPIRKNHE